MYYRALALKRITKTKIYGLLKVIFVHASAAVFEEDTILQ